jgi:hypothetical protein
VKFEVTIGDGNDIDGDLDGGGEKNIDGGGGVFCTYVFVVEVVL